MLKNLTVILIVALTVLALTGCPGVLTSDLPSDLMISLGVFSPAEGVTSLRSAVGGKIFVPVFINDQNSNSVSGSHDVTFTLDTDGDLATTGDNIVVGTLSIASGTETIAALDVPGAAVAATYNLFASMAAAAGEPAVDIGGTLLNVASVQIVIGATNEADLEITVVDPPSQFRAAGTAFPVSFKITNTGNKMLASGTSVAVRFEIDINGVFTSFGSVSVELAAELYPNAFTTGTAEVTMPTLAQMAADDGVAEADVDDWFDNVRATVDPDNAITELVEGGTDFFSVMSGTQQPDLEISAIDLPSFAIVGGTVEAAVTVLNSGYAAAAAGSYNVLLFLDADSNSAYDAGTDTAVYTWSAADNPAVPWDSDGSGSGNTVVLSTSGFDAASYPAAVTAGTQDMGVIITDGPTEWDTANNDDYTTIEVLSKNIDLGFSSISTTLATVIDDAAGGTIPVALVVSNDGDEAVTADFDIAFYASPNNGINTSGAGEISLGTLNVTDSIQPGKTVINYDAVIASGSGGGFYTVFAVLDSGGAVTETDESNNAPSSAAVSPAYIVVDDGGNLTANVIVCLPKGAASANYYYQYLYYYDDLWSLNSSNSFYKGSQTGPDILGTLGITLTNGQAHGIRLFAYTENVAYAWKLVPDYITTVDTGSIPYALISDDMYENNDTSGTASELSGASHPFFSWISSFDSTSNDNDYYRFDF